MSSIFDAIDEGDDPFGTEPTAYDLHVARAREERQLQAQVRKYGDNEMRVDRGSLFLFNLQRKPGELATDLQIRGTLLGDPRVDAKQEMVVVAVSDSIYNIGWQSPSETPVLTQVAPIVG